MNKWNDFSDAEELLTYELIPHRTIAKVELHLKQGGYITDEFKDGSATLSKAGTSIYLSCEFVVLKGDYQNRKIWSNIVLHHDNFPKYAEIGRSTIKAILESARTIHPKDKSQEADKLRQINNFSDLDNLTCLAEITINNKGEQPRNEIKTFLTPAHPKYDEYMGEQNNNFSIKPKPNQNTSTHDTFPDDEIPF